MQSYFLIASQICIFIFQLIAIVIFIIHMHLLQIMYHLPCSTGNYFIMRSCLESSNINEQEPSWSVQQAPILAPVFTLRYDYMVDLTFACIRFTNNAENQIGT